MTSTNNPSLTTDDEPKNHPFSRAHPKNQISHHNDDDDSHDDKDDQRHMNDSTMPPPSINMPPPKSKLPTTTTTVRTNSVTTTTKSNRRPTTTTSISRTPAEIATGRRHNKVPTALGLGDWMRLLSVTKDIAQLKGQSIRRNITPQEVQQHRTIHDGWIILHQTRVYNISPYLSYHPGGVNILKSVLGKDATALFQKYHPWVNIDGLIGKLLIGYLDTTTKSNDDSDDDDQ